MANGDGVKGPDKKKLWTLYGKVRAAQRQGLDYNTINEEIRAATSGKVNGIATLENLLGVNQGETKGRGQRLKESVANVADAVLLGYGGEVRGAVRGAGAALTGGDFSETYSAEQAKFDSMVEGAEETNPLAAGIGRGAGYGASGLLAAGVAPVRAGTVAARASAPLRGQILGGAGRGALGGAIGGGLEGASDPGNRLAGGVRGGMVGGLFGTGVGAFIPAAGAAIGATASRLAGSMQPAERKATGLLGRAMERARIPAEELAERAGPAGERIADQAGSLRREARAARNVAPQLDDGVDGGASVVDDVIAREHGRGQRVAAGLREQADLPSGYDPSKVFDAHHARWLEDHVSPHYGTKVPSAGLGLEDNPQLTRALRRAGLNPDDLPAEVDFQKLWATRQELARRVRNQNGNYNQYEVGKAQEAMRHLEEFLDQKVPGAGQIFSEYKRIKQVEELYDIGRQLGGGDAGLDLSQAIEMAGDDPEKLTSLRQGLMSWFEGKLLRKGSGGSVAQDLMSLPPRTRKQLQTLFGQDRLDELQRFMADELQGRELRWSKLTRALQGNSTTAQQQADMAEMLGPARVPTLRTLYNRIWTAAMTNVDFSRDVAYEYGKMLLDDLSEAQIRRITDTMVELAGAEGMSARGIVPGGAAASEYGPSLWDRTTGKEQEQPPRGSLFDPIE